jgi:hypothetical protein
MPARKAYPLRIPPEVYEAIRKWADDDLRSVNAQIEFLLARALREAGRHPRSERKRNERKGPGRSD